MSPQSANTSDQKREGAPPQTHAWWIGLLLFVGTALLFSRAVQNEFVNYDDPDYVTANAQVRGGLSKAGIAWAFSTGEVSYWHPLTWVSHMADWSLFGSNPTGHHAMNVFWHALNAVLVFAVFRRLTGRLLLAALAASLFAWHPLRVESVAWVAERKDVLSGFFWLGTILAYLAYAARRDAKQRGAWARYVATMALFAAALMSKPMAVTLPVILLVLDFWPLRRVGSERALSLVLEKAPLFVLSAIVGCVTMIAQRNVGTLTDALALPARLANAVIAVMRYLGTIFAPHDLAVLYPHPGHWPIAAIGGAMGVFLLLTAAALWQTRRRPWILAGWLWFLAALLPASGVIGQVGIQSMADRYTYLPVLGIELAVLCTLAGFGAARGVQAAWTAAGIAAMAALSWQTWNQLSVWRDSLTLFHHTIAVAGEGNYLAYNNRGICHVRQGRLDLAIEDYRRSLAINSEYPESNSNLGEALMRQGRRAEAIELYRKALRLKPNLPEAHNNLANALSDQGEFAEAIRHHELALTGRAYDALFLNNYGATLAASGRVQESLKIFERAARTDPGHPGLRSNMGNALALLGRRDEAVTQYRLALESEPNDIRTLFNFGIALGEMGRYEDSAAQFRRVLQLSEPNPDAHVALGQVLLRLGKRGEAILHFETALRQRPDHASARAMLSSVTNPAP